MGNTADKMTRIIGLERVKPLLDALEEGGEPARIARESLQGVSQESLLMVEVAHVCDRIEDQVTRLNGSLAKLWKEHNATMRGEGSPCRHVQNLKLRGLVAVLVIIVIPLALMWADGVFTRRQSDAQMETMVRAAVRDALGAARRLQP